VGEGGERESEKKRERGRERETTGYKPFRPGPNRNFNRNFARDLTDISTGDPTDISIARDLTDISTGVSLETSFDSYSMCVPHTWRGGARPVAQLQSQGSP